MEQGWTRAKGFFTHTGPLVQSQNDPAQEAIALSPLTSLTSTYITLTQLFSKNVFPQKYFLKADNSNYLQIF